MDLYDSVTYNVFPGWTSLDTKPRRNYLDQSARPRFNGIQDSTEAGQIYNKAVADNTKSDVVKTTADIPAYKKTLTEKIDADPYAPGSTTFFEGLGDGYYSRIDADVVRVSDVFPWVDSTKWFPVKSAPTTPIGADSKMQEAATVTGTKPITFLDESLPSKEYAIELDSLKLGNRYARLKEVARTLVKLYITEGSDSEAVDVAMADLVEEL